MSRTQETEDKQKVATSSSSTRIDSRRWRARTSQLSGHAYAPEYTRGSFTSTLPVVYIAAVHVRLLLTTSHDTKQRVPRAQNYAKRRLGPSYTRTYLQTRPATSWAAAAAAAGRLLPGRVEGKNSKTLAHLVGLRKGLELFRVSSLIRVLLLGELAVSLGDGARVCCLPHLQNLERERGGIPKKKAATSAALRDAFVCCLEGGLAALFRAAMRTGEIV